MRLSAFSEAELLETFHGGSMSGKHMLLLYSMIIGLQAKIIVDLGLGNSTRTCRAAARITKGKVHSCDMDRERFLHYETEGADDWQFFCRPSFEFIKLLPEPIDLVFHDASHEHDVVRDDLMALFPKMRRYGLILVHDTQHPRFRLLEAIDDAIRSSECVVSTVTMPYACGLTIMRIEESRQPAINPAVEFRGDRRVTVPRALNTSDAA